MNHFKRWAAIVISATVLWSGAMACSGGGQGPASDTSGDFSGKLPTDTVNKPPVVTSPPTVTTQTPPSVPCTYTYSDWGECHADGTQARTVASTTPSECTGTPVVTQSCVYVAQPQVTPKEPPQKGPPPKKSPVACVYTYSDWGACQPNNTQARTVTSAAPDGCAGEPLLSQPCVFVPPPILAKPKLVLKLQGYDLSDPGSYITVDGLSVFATNPPLPAGFPLLFDPSGTTGVDLVLNLLKITGPDGSVIFNDVPKNKQDINFPKGGIYSVLFQATANGGSDSKTYKIQIADKPVVKSVPKIPTATLAGVDNGKTYEPGDFNFSVVNPVNVDSYHWELTGPGLDKPGIVDPSLAFIKVVDGKLVRDCSAQCDALKVSLPDPQNGGSDAYTMTVTVTSSTGDTATSVLAFTVVKTLPPTSTIAAMLDNAPMVDGGKYKVGVFNFMSTNEINVAKHEWTLSSPAGPILTGKDPVFVPAIPIPAVETQYTVTLVVISSTSTATQKKFTFTLLPADQIPSVEIAGKDGKDAVIAKDGKYAAGEFKFSAAAAVNVKTYKWALTKPDNTIIDGGTGAVFMPNPKIVANLSKEDTYMVSLMVTSATGNQITKTLSFIVEPLPIPKITSDAISVMSGMSWPSGLPLTLHGKDSLFATDYRWVIESATGAGCGKECINQPDFNAAQENVTFTPSLAGGYRVTLFAKGVGGEANLLVDVKTAGPLVAGFKCTLPNSKECIDGGKYPTTGFRFDAFTSIPAVGIESYEWSVDGKVVATKNSAAELYIFTPGAIGDYAVSLRVKKGGVFSLPKMMTIHVVAAPKITLLSESTPIETLLAHPYTYYAGDERTLDATQTTGSDATTITVTSPSGNPIPNKVGVPVGVYKFTPSVKGSYKIHVHAEGAGGVADKDYSLDILAELP